MHERGKTNISNTILHSSTPAERAVECKMVFLMLKTVALLLQAIMQLFLHDIREGGGGKEEGREEGRSGRKESYNRHWLVLIFFQLLMVM
jgi:hypothetical protein